MGSCHGEATGALEWQLVQVHMLVGDPRARGAGR